MPAIETKHTLNVYIFMYAHIHGTYIKDVYACTVFVEEWVTYICPKHNIFLNINTNIIDIIIVVLKM